MQIGSLYKSKGTDIIVKCVKIHDDKFFSGEVVNESYYPKGLVHDDWFIPNFELYEEKPSATQIGGGHYSKYAIQPTEFIHKNKVPFIEGNIIKYVMRHRDKNGIEDLKKAKHYIDLLIEFEYKNETY